MEIRQRKRGEELTFVNLFNLIVVDDLQSTMKEIEILWRPTKHGPASQQRCELAKKYKKKKNLKIYMQLNREKPQRGGGSSDVAYDRVL